MRRWWKSAGLRELGFTVKEAAASDCRRVTCSRPLLTEDASGNRIDLVVRRRKVDAAIFLRAMPASLHFTASVFVPPTAPRPAFCARRR